MHAKKIIVNKINAADNNNFLLPFSGLMSEEKEKPKSPNENSGLDMAENCSDVSHNLKNIESRFSISSEDDQSDLKSNHNTDISYATLDYLTSPTKTEKNRKRKLLENLDRMTDLDLDLLQSKKSKRGRPKQDSRVTKSFLKQEINEISLFQSADLNIQSDKMQNESLFSFEWLTQDDSKRWQEIDRNQKSLGKESSSDDGSLSPFRDPEDITLSDNDLNDVDLDTESLLKNFSWTENAFPVETEEAVQFKLECSVITDDDNQVSNLEKYQISKNQSPTLNQNSKIKEEDSNESIKFDVNYSCVYCPYISQFRNGLKEHLKSKHPQKSNTSVQHLLFNLRKYSKKQIDPKERIFENLTTGEHACLQCDFVSLSKTEAWKHSANDHLSLKVLSCLRCPKLFQFKKNILSHLKEAHDDTLTKNNKNFQCEICDKNNSTHFVLLRHYRLKHPELKLLSCGECSLEFTSEVKLQDHQIAIHNEANVKNENSENKHNCIKCTAHFETSQQLKEHQREVHVKWFNCKHCNYRTDQHGNIGRHVKTVHSKEKDFMCHGCFKTVTEKKTLEAHININKAENGSTILTCEKYSKIYLRDSELIHHEAHNLQYLCLLCSFGSKKLEEVQSHIYGSHHKSQRRVIICNQCQKEFPTIAETLKHWDMDHKHVISLGEAQVKQENVSSHNCSNCGLQFNFEKTLFLHAKKLHSGQSWTCDVCQNKFVTKKTIIEHVKTIHQNDASITIPKPIYHCSECQNTFGSRTQLIQHIKQTHRVQNAEAKTKFKCEFCGHMTEQIGNMRRHIKIIHKKQKDYMCKGCSRSFGERKTYDYHTGNHMPKDNSTLMTCMKYNTVSIDTKDLIHQSSDKTSFLCLLCNLLIKNKGEIEEHIEKAHERTRKIKSCKVCLLELRTTTDVFVHWEKFHPEIDSVDSIPEPEATMSSHSCNLCDKQFKYSKLVKLHSKRIHPKKEPVNCNECQLKFKSKRLFMVHNNDKHPFLIAKAPTVFNCNECNISFKGKSTLKVHMEQLHPNFPLPDYLSNLVELRCDKCLFKTEQSGNLARHINQVHLKISEFVCKQCSRQFSDNKNFMVHIKSNTDLESDTMHCTKYTKVYPDVLNQFSQNEEDGLFTCLKCSLAASTRDDIIEHLKKNHPQEGKTICKKCQLYAASKWRVIEHWDNCDGKSVKVEEQLSTPGSRCIICSYEPKTRDNLLEHIQSIHGNEKEHKCNSCYEQFSQNSILVKHLVQNGCQYSVTFDQLLCSKFVCITTKNFDVSKFLTLQDGLFSCNECPFNSFAKNLAKMHVKLKHSSLPRKNQYLCRMCSTPPFKTRSRILGHLRDLHGLKTEFEDKNAVLKVEYSYCKECPYKSDTPANLNRHVSAVHLKERNFTCEECGNSYSDKKALHIHITLKHG